MDAIDPGRIAIFLVVAFSLAGIAQTAWFAAPVSHSFDVPLDGGLTLRGRRLFGDNKTFRGFVMMIPACACTFPLTATLAGTVKAEQLGLWPLSAAAYAALGAWAALGFMAGELPNSLIKRQLDIAPGESASGPARFVQFGVDRLDSGVGMLVAVGSVVPTPVVTWVAVLGFRVLVHWSFSVLMFHLGLKRRPA
jgi:CDP-2,3-bis-(O-geranylgeranyl)-sn-glycerol synthase